LGRVLRRWTEVYVRYMGNVEARWEADLGDGARAIRDGQSGGLGDGVGLATMGQSGSLWTIGGEGRDGLNDGRVACSHSTGGQSQKSH
jgi:hypothetical protein